MAKLLLCGLACLGLLASSALANPLNRTVDVTALHVQVDKDGTPILFNATVPTEADILKLLEANSLSIAALESDSIGFTKVHLDGRSEICRRMECNLGNLIAESMIFARVLQDHGSSYWTDAPIAFVQSGGIQSSIEKRADGSVTRTDILAALPSSNDLYVTKITGKLIRNALEHAATVVNKKSDGGFLQMSGVWVEYDLDQPEGHRVVSVQVRCGECAVPTFSELVDSHTYGVIVDSFLLNGGEDHVFKEPTNPQTIPLQLKNSEALTQYFQKRQFVYPELDDRIQVRGSAGVIFGSMALVMISTLLSRIFN